MITSQWQPLLYGCPPPSFSGYRWLTDHPANNHLEHILNEYSGQSNLLPEERTKWIIGEKDGRVFFGRQAWLDELLGSEHPAARDGVGRRLGFLLGYSAPAGTPLPSESDFGRIEATIKRDVEKFLVEFFQTKTVGSITPEPTPFDFSGSQSGAASAWDKMASEIEGGKKSTLLVINQRGDIETKDLAPKPEPEPKKNQDTARPETGREIRGWGYEPEPGYLQQACDWARRHSPFQQRQKRQRYRF